MQVDKSGTQTTKTLSVKTDQTRTRTENRIQTESQTPIETKMRDKLLKGRAVIKTEMLTVILIRTEDQTLTKNQATNHLTQTKIVAVVAEKVEAKEKMLRL